MIVCLNCGSENADRNEFCETCAGRLDVSSPGIDRYTLEGVLGRGASSVVYRATDARTGGAVAVKALNPELIARPGLRERLREEARALQQLSHENIVRVLDYVESDEAVWLVTEAVEGASLRTILIHAHQLEPEQALAIFAGMLAGIAHAHERGIVHGDLKPENVLVEASGTAKLVDFGQAVRAGEATTGGTASYMSPEAARGEALTPASDLYSVGAVLYETLTGRPPFLAATEDALLRQQMSEPAPAITGLPPAIGSLVGALLDKDPARRPASAGDALGAFEAAVRESYGTEWRRRAGVANLVETSATRFPTLTTAPAGAPGTGRATGGAAADLGAPYAASSGADDGTDDSAEILSRSDVVKGVAILRWVLAAEVLWMLVFAAGGALNLWTLAQNGQSAVTCGLGGSPFNVSLQPCGTHHSFVLGFVLVGVGFLGALVTWIVAYTWFIKRFGFGVVAYLRRRRGWRPNSPGMFGQPGTPLVTEQPPSHFGPASWPGGMPPGTPGSPTGPSIS